MSEIKKFLLSFKGMDNFISKKVTMIACPWIFQEYVEFKSQNLALAYIGSFIEENGHQVISYIDPMIKNEDFKLKINCGTYSMYRFGMSDLDIVQQIPKETDYVFINAPFTDSKFVLYDLCKEIKQNYPYIKIVVGGVLATYLGQEVLQDSCVDIIVNGEGEIASTKILHGLPLYEICGVSFREDDKLFYSDSKADKFEDINDIPMLKNSHFRPMEDYIKWSPRGNKLERTFSYISSRGCPFSCNFCSIPEKNQKIRCFSSERVIEEIDFMINKYSINHIEIEDDNFTLNQEHSHSILNYIADVRSGGYDISVSFPNGVMIKTLEEEDIKLFKHAGVETVYLPVESGDVKNLILMNKFKPFSHLEKVLEVTGWCKQYGIQSGAFFILAYPGGIVIKDSYKEFILSNYKDDILSDKNGELLVRGEDELSFEKSFDFMKKLKQAGVNFITPLIATSYPGTALYDLCKEQKWLKTQNVKNIITTISYQNLNKEFINVDTTWCSFEEAYYRWLKISEFFSTKHNIIKK